jgi:DNA polymerase-1
MTSTDKRLYLIDAYAMIFRGYFAFIKNPESLQKVLIHQLFLVYQFFDKLIKRDRPTHLAVVFDVGKTNVRHEDFTEYKANRQDTPEPILIAVPYIHRILEAMHIPILGVEGYEADDVIGTIACKAEKQNYNVFMVTPDKDFAQLVTDKIKIYKPGLKEVILKSLVLKKLKPNMKSVIQSRSSIILE